MGCDIELENITNAIKTRDLLRKNRYNAKIEKSSGKTKKGCAYVVKTDADCFMCRKITAGSGIKVINLS